MNQLNPVAVVVEDDNDDDSDDSDDSDDDHGCYLAVVVGKGFLNE